MHQFSSKGCADLDARPVHGRRRARAASPLPFLLGVCAAVLALTSLGASPAAAQGMTFSLEESGQSTAKSNTPPSQTLAHALQLYQAERYDEAAVQFERVVDGQTKDAPGNVEQAQFFLGKALFHERFYQSALNLFDLISKVGPKHRYYNQSLEWLAQLAQRLPESAGIIDRVGRYGVGALEQFNTPEQASLYHELLYLMGRHRYRQGELDDAVELFSKIPITAARYVEAQFFIGVTQVRLHHARPAIAAFRHILDAIRRGQVRGPVDQSRMRNLAWLSLARVYYTAANETDPATGETHVDGRLLGQAVESWDQVQQSSEYWLDAEFESSWAFFLADEYARALGNIHTIFSPYFEDAYYPEALVVKAVTFFVNCQIDNAEATIGQFHERYDQVRDELEAKLGSFEDNTQFFEFLRAVRAGKADLSPRLRGIVSTAIGDRTVLRNLAYVDELDEEQARLQRAPKELQRSAVGARILQDTALAKSFAVDATGDLVRARYARLLRDLQDLTNQMDTIELEIATYQRGQLNQSVQAQMSRAQRSKGGNVQVDDEHQLWPFDGEYWRDELGFYRQQVTNVCTR